ncbi:phosphoenolpyruvate--protein phosphotransferase [Anaerotalea alkaliphila]|uniref:Phosphoenolpyruvate-protein phosphotransferase n=1 Tax=Anaerotalea alkaliphila TaxID=2662126 RepID=A0A7X5KPK5_9FIRM|nr:phosphoenolpyruvate--protein phosphotransferase [Anaerotalea alkaliphila]NDL68267.1 phosphoenolpyruvate--protein phosphotransferase [Anaerotalea alkaliphila]
MRESRVEAIGVSPGIGKGNLLVLLPGKVPEKVPCVNPDEELQRLEKALTQAGWELESLHREGRGRLGEEKAAVFAAHRMILEDPLWTERMREGILGSGWDGAYAVHVAAEETAGEFQRMENPYFQERAADILDIGNRLVRILQGRPAADLAVMERDTVVVAWDLAPSDAALLDPEKVKGIATVQGGKTSHTAIIARTLGIPMVAGIGAAFFESLVQGEEAIVDGAGGRLIRMPDRETRRRYAEAARVLEEEARKDREWTGRPTRTKDGKRLEIAANIASPQDLEQVLANGADGIGLFRSEFLYMEGTTPPSEEVQYQAYRKVLEGMGDRPVVVRTMDIGGDKEVACLGMEREENPFLGCRAVRYCLKNPEVFKVQLRALLRASCHGNLKILVPMVASAEEVRQVKTVLSEVEAALQEEGIPFRKGIPLGIMIEVPAAALCSDILAREVDFFSIGTNDLVQYTLAADRMNPKVSHLYSHYHPSVLRLVGTAIRNGHQAGITVGMCGAAAEDPGLLGVLAGMGLDEFSISPTRIPGTRRRLSEIHTRKAADQVERILEQDTAEAVLEVLGKERA